MLVMKFGGSSVANAERVKNVCAIVKNNLHRHPVMVVSAHGGVTDMLIDAAKRSVTGKLDISPIRKIHLDMVKELKLDPAPTEKLLNELEVLLQGISLVRELTPRTLDYVMSFGERLSIRTVAAYMTSQGVHATAVESCDLGMITSSDFGSATPLPEADPIIEWNIKRYDTVPVITGFIGKDKKGNITTLGRNGSDYTAAIVGAAIGAEEIQIWSDVDGVMTADPTIIKEAMPIEKMSFDEASELAYYGGRLHPYTLIPAVRKSIPIRILNTFEPDNKGTLILSESKETEGVIKSIVYKENLFLINVVSTRMLFHHGFMAKIFEIFNNYSIVIDMIATSEVSVSLTTDNDVNLDAAIKDLAQFAEVTVEPDKAIICVVGEGLKHSRSVTSTIFNAVEKGKINVQMISQSAKKINIAFLIDDDDILTTVQLLHNTFFSKKQ